VHEAHYFGQWRIESRDCVAHLIARVRARLGVKAGDGLSQTMAQTTTSPLSTKMIQQAVVSNLEQPHARCLRIPGHGPDAPPGCRHRVGQQVRSVVGSHTAAKVAE
jgi:hypothetical protein